MRSRWQLIALALVLFIIPVAGCSRRTSSLVTGTGNQAPVVRLERPAPSAGAEEHHLAWTGTDFDGRIDHYEITPIRTRSATGAGAWERRQIARPA
jgi:hypothetical protein